MAISRSRDRTTLAALEIVGCLFLFIGGIVGFSERTTGEFGGDSCGSVLGGGGRDLSTTGIAVCEKALSAVTTWTWILVIVGVLLLVAGWVIDAIQKNGWEQRRACGAATA